MSNSTRKLWTRDELILAINLYCKTPFGRIHNRNPEIIELAALLGRTPSSVSYKLANFASIDPSLERKGAANIGKLDKEVWEEFFQNWEGMVFESEAIAIKRRGEESLLLENEEEPLSGEGETKQAIVNRRVNQHFFRKMILASYDFSCCMTGLSLSELLVASHIVPWAKDAANRMNPRNGLCLNALHDRAFDVGLISVDDDFRVLVSEKAKRLPKEKVEFLFGAEGKKIMMPKRFIPDRTFLRFHRENIFQ